MRKKLGTDPNKTLSFFHDWQVADATINEVYSIDINEVNSWINEMNAAIIRVKAELNKVNESENN